MNTPPPAQVFDSADEGAPIHMPADGVSVVPIEEARRKAENAGLDLVEVSPTARPPVCRILDYGKFKYDQAKRERSGPRHHTQQLKGVQLGLLNYAGNNPRWARLLPQPWSL